MTDGTGHPESAAAGPAPVGGRTGDPHRLRPLPGRVGRHEPDPPRRGVRPGGRFPDAVRGRHVAGRPARHLRHATGSAPSTSAGSGSGSASRSGRATRSPAAARSPSSTPIPTTASTRVDVELTCLRQTGGVAVTGVGDVRVPPNRARTDRLDRPGTPGEHVTGHESITSAALGDGIVEVVMAHPPVNALPVAGWFDLADAVTAAGADPDVRVVVLRAEGRGFNAGVDIKEIQRTDGLRRADRRQPRLLRGLRGGLRVRGAGDRRGARLLPRRRHRAGRQRRRHRGQRGRDVRPARGRPRRARRGHPPVPAGAAAQGAGDDVHRRQRPPPPSCTRSARCSPSCRATQLRDAALELRRARSPPRTRR